MTTRTLRFHDGYIMEVTERQEEALRKAIVQVQRVLVAYNNLPDDCKQVVQEMIVERQTVS